MGRFDSWAAKVNELDFIYKEKEFYYLIFDDPLKNKEFPICVNGDSVGAAPQITVSMHISEFASFLEKSDKQYSAHLKKNIRNFVEFVKYGAIFDKEIIGSSNYFEFDNLWLQAQFISENELKKMILLIQE